MSNKLIVTILDEVNNKKVKAELPGDAFMRVLVPALVAKMQLSFVSQYGLYHKESDEQLDDNTTLFGAGVKSGDTLILRPINVSPILDKIKVTVIYQAGGTQMTAELPVYPTMSRLMPALITKMRLPKYAANAIFHRESGKLLRSDDTLQKLNVKSGDTLILIYDPNVVENMPLRSFREIQLFEAILSQSGLINELGRYLMLFAIFLYTEEDTHLASFIRKNIHELHQMAGQECIFFTVEQPVAEWDSNLRRTLGKLAKDYFDSLYERLGTDTFKPFKKNQAYILGQHLGVTPNQFPCMIFFSDLKSNQVAIVEINKFIDIKNSDLASEYTHFFKVAFSMSQEAMRKNGESWIIELGKLLEAEWDGTINKNEDFITSIELDTSIIEAVGALIDLIISSK